MKVRSAQITICLAYLTLAFLPMISGKVAFLISAKLDCPVMGLKWNPDQPCLFYGRDLESTLDWMVFFSWLQPAFYIYFLAAAGVAFSDKILYSLAKIQYKSSQPVGGLFWVNIAIVTIMIPVFLLAIAFFIL